MRPRSWPAVSVGRLTGSALAIAGNPHSRARPTATAAHLRTTWSLTKILAGWSRFGQDGHSIRFAQTPNNVTITARFQERRLRRQQMPLTPLVRTPPHGLGSGTVSNDRKTLTGTAVAGRTGVSEVTNG